MKKVYKIIIIVVLGIVSIIPFYTVKIVPEWELVFVNTDGTPIPSMKIDQIWTDYSLEYVFAGGHSERELQTDSTGYIKLPARNIKVSIFQIITSRIRDLIMGINPHASFGPDSYIVCRGSYNCIVNYKDENIKPQRVIVR